MPISKDYQTVICHTKREGKAITQTRILMTYLTPAEYARFERYKKITLKREVDFEIEESDVIAYGEVDLHTGTDDYYGLQEVIGFDNVVHLPANYDYNTHTCKVPIDCKGYKTYETSNVGAMAQYAHGKLGKPSAIIIFKIVTKKW